MSARIFANRKVPWKHMTAGLLGGVAATVAMSQFQNALQKMTKPAQSPQPEQPEPENEDATVKAAAKLSRLAGYELSRATKKKAAPLVHYGFGTIMGAIYGMAKAKAPRPVRHPRPLLSGTAFGSALFLAAHELTVPALGLAPKPSEVAFAEHASELTAHLVYGLTLEAVHALTLKLL